MLLATAEKQYRETGYILRWAPSSGKKIFSGVRSP